MALADQKSKITGNIDLTSKVKINRTNPTGRHTKSPTQVKRSVPFAGGTPER